MDNFIQADIYTSSQAIDGITGALTDYGITGFIITDSADFESFLADKNANWDYVDDELMGLSKAEPRITLYVHDNAQGAETLAAIKSLIEGWKANNSDGYYGNLRMELANVKEEDWEQLEEVLQALPRRKVPRYQALLGGRYSVSRRPYS